MANRFTKTTRAQQEILNLIARDRMARGDRLPTEKELEAAIGVSIITVRRALAELAGRGLIERIQGKGTFLSQDVGRDAIFGRVAFLLVDRPTALYEQTLEEARRTAHRRGYQMELVTTGPRPDSTVTALLQDVIGVVVTGRPDDVWMDWLEMMHLPSVVLGVHRLAKPAWRVQHDFEKAVGLAVDALVQRGCGRIGLVNAAPRYMPAHQMYGGFMRAMQRHQRVWSDDDVVWCRHDDRLVDLETFFAHRGDIYDGLIVETGCLRAWLMFMYEHEEVRSRPQLALIGGDAAEEPRGLSRFTSVRFRQGIGPAAVDLLFEAISADESATRTVLIPPLALDARPEAPAASDRGPLRAESREIPGAES